MSTSYVAGSTTLTIAGPESFERLQNSRNGNPRYRITFTNGQSAVTHADAGLVYGVTNRENIGVPVRVRFDARGQITDIEPV